MQAIGKVQGKQLKFIPNNTEKYISFSLGCIDFIDSFQFMSSSLERLVENLAKEGPQIFNHMTDYFGKEKIDLLLRKHVYPYEHLNSECKFTEKQLPPKDTFYSSLSGEDISEEAYK